MDNVWITVENKRVFGDIELGISKAVVKGFNVIKAYPHLSPQLLKVGFDRKMVLVWEVICNYKKVTSFTHLLTAVITTNFKYKTFSWRVRPTQLVHN